MKFLTKFTVALGTVCLIGGSAFGQTVNSDSWAATDALGRKVSEYKDAGDKKKDKFIAMFYWTWHQGNDDTTYQVKNISEIVRRGATNVRAFSSGNSRCWVTTKRPTPGYCANTPKCWPTQAWTPYSSIARTAVLPGRIRTKR